MSSASEVEIVFSIESGTGGLDADLIRLRGLHNRVELVRELIDTSLQFFIELVNQNGDSCGDSVKIGLLKVGPDIYYPLNKSKTLIYLLDNGAYLFPPDTDNSEPECHLVINLGENINPHAADTFREILSVYSSVVEEAYGNDPVIDRIIEYYRSPHPSKVQTAPTSEMNGSEAFAMGMVKTAEVFAAGLDWVTERASGLIHHGGSKLRGMNIPQRRANVDPKVIAALRAAKVASGCTKTLVESASTAVASGTQRLGQAIAPVFVDKGSKLVSNVTGMDNSSSENVMNGIVTVGSGGLQAIGVIAGSVTDSAMSLGRAVAEETVGLVNQAFGSPAARATSDAFETAGNVARSYRNIREIRPKNILKKTAINTAIATAQMNGASSLRDDQEEETRRDYTYPKYPHYPPYPNDPKNGRREPQ